MHCLPRSQYTRPSFDSHGFFSILLAHPLANIHIHIYIYAFLSLSSFTHTHTHTLSLSLSLSLCHYFRSFFSCGCISSYSHLQSYCDLPYDLPPKRYFGNLDRQFILERQKALQVHIYIYIYMQNASNIFPPPLISHLLPHTQHYLNQVLSFPPAQYSHHLRLFLDPSHYEKPFMGTLQPWLHSIGNARVELHNQLILSLILYLQTRLCQDYPCSFARSLLGRLQSLFHSQVCDCVCMYVCVCVC